MATLSAGRGTARHRRKPARRLAAERLVAVDGAWLLCFGLLAAGTIRHPEPAAILCGICGITGPGVARQGARLAAGLWDRGHRSAAMPVRREARHQAANAGSKRRIKAVRAPRGPDRTAEWERDRDTDPTAGRAGPAGS